MTYECHITLRPDAALPALMALLGWSYSCITDDPQLGPGSRCYATKYYATDTEAIQGTRGAAELFRVRGFHVYRAKVEHVVYDTHMSTGVVS